MRAFLGIDLDDEVRAALAELATAARDAVPGWRGEKWVPPENLHLTVRFLGEVDAEFVAGVTGALQPALLRQQPFSIPPLVLVEPVPEARRTRMLWTRFDDQEGRCAALAAAVDDALASLGMPPETRPFVPHVTLARARRPRAYPAAAELSAHPVPSVSVHEVTLFSSVLRHRHPRYERLATISVGAR